MLRKRAKYRRTQGARERLTLVIALTFWSAAMLCRFGTDNAFHLTRTDHLRVFLRRVPLDGFSGLILTIRVSLQRRTLKAERPTSNSDSGTLSVGRWTLSVGRFLPSLKGSVTALAVRAPQSATPMRVALTNSSV